MVCYFCVEMKNIFTVEAPQITQTHYIISATQHDLQQSRKSHTNFNADMYFMWYFYLIEQQNINFYLRYKSSPSVKV